MILMSGCKLRIYAECVISSVCVQQRPTSMFTIQANFRFYFRGPNDFIFISAGPQMISLALSRKKIVDMIKLKKLQLRQSFMAQTISSMTFRRSILAS